MSTHPPATPRAVRPEPLQYSYIIVPLLIGGVAVAETVSSIGLRPSDFAPVLWSVSIAGLLEGLTTGAPGASNVAHGLLPLILVRDVRVAVAAAASAAIGLLLLLIPAWPYRRTRAELAGAYAIGISLANLGLGHLG